MTRSDVGVVGDGSVDQAREPDEGLCVVPLDVFAQDLAAVYVEGGDDRDGAVADVFELPAGASAGAGGLVGVFAGAGGDAGLLVHADHHGVRRAGAVQVADLGGPGERTPDRPGGSATRNVSRPAAFAAYRASSAASSTLAPDDPWSG